MASRKSFINLGVFSLVQDETIADYLISFLNTRKTNSEFIRLLAADLRSYIVPSHLDAVILVHPYTEGRLSLTDVTDARYTTLLPTLNAHFGSHRICVIAYLVRNVKEHTQQTHLDMLKLMQPTVLQSSNYIIICGSLKDMFPRDLNQIKQFVKVSWETTTQTSWKDEWFPKPEVVDVTSRQQIIPSKVPTTDKTTEHTKHDGYDLSETTNDNLRSEQVMMHAHHNIEEQITIERMRSEKPPRDEHVEACAGLQKGSQKSHMNADMKLKSLLEKGIADSQQRQRSYTDSKTDGNKEADVNARKKLESLLEKAMADSDQRSHTYGQDDEMQKAYVKAGKKLESFLDEAMAKSNLLSYTDSKDTVDQPTPFALADSYDFSSTVLVTDASGFIAAHVVDKLTRLGMKVRGTLDLDEGTLDSFEKGTLDTEAVVAEVATLKGRFPKLDLCEAGIRHYSGWIKAVRGCTYVIHTSRFQNNRPATEDDVTKLLQACKDDGEVKRVVVTGGSHSIYEEMHRNEEGEIINTALKETICKHAPKNSAFYKCAESLREEVQWEKEWQSINSALKDAICKDVSGKEALRFMETEKPTFGLSIIKPPIVLLGPILCQLAEANVEIVRRRMVDTKKGLLDFSLPICDVRDVAEAHIKALKITNAVDINVGVVPHRLKLKEMAVIMEKEFKKQGYDFPTIPIRWDSMARCLSDLYGSQIEPKSDEQMVGHVLVDDPIDKEKSVIDMAYSCIERGVIPKKTGYNPREQDKRD